MTDLDNPSQAQVFVVGYNPASAYHSNAVDYERFIDSLFNRNGETCREFYKEVTDKSPTRGNIEMFTRKLADAGVTSVIETNVVCYGAKKKRHLSLPEHNGGKRRGVQIFRELISEIQPKVIVVHGIGVCKEFTCALNLAPPLPEPPNNEDMFVDYQMGQIQIFVIPSLADPGFRNWPSSPHRSFCNWADGYLNKIAGRVARACAA